MNFELDEAQRMLQESAREFLAGYKAKAAEPEHGAPVPTALPADMWRTMVEAGWPGINIPEQWGGAGYGLTELMVIVQEMGRALVPGPFLSTALSVECLKAGGNTGLQERWLPAVAAGHAALTLALLDAGGDWSPGAVRCQAFPAGDGYRLQGVKRFVTDPAAADAIIVAARLYEESAGPSGGVGLFLVERGAGGMLVDVQAALDPARSIGTVSLHNVRVPAAARLQAGDAALLLEQTLSQARAVLAAEMVGGMERALELTVAYAKERQQFGRPIGSFQAIQHRCADMLVQLEGARSAAYYAVLAVDQGLASAHAAAAMAKAYCSTAFRQLTASAIQVHGGIGFTWEHPIHLYYRRAQTVEPLFGGADDMWETVAGWVIDRGDVALEAW